MIILNVLKMFVILIMEVVLSFQFLVRLKMNVTLLPVLLIKVVFRLISAINANVLINVILTIVTHQLAVPQQRSTVMMTMHVLLILVILQKDVNMKIEIAIMETNVSRTLVIQ